MISYDSKNWIRVLREVPRSRTPGSVTGPDAPHALLSSLHRAVQADLSHGHLVSDARITLAPILQQFNDVMGACERIRNTPIPYSYSAVAA